MGCSERYDLIRTAYRFVGDQTRNYLDFRFVLEPTEDLQDQVIKDIFHCNSLRCIEGKDWVGEPKFLQFIFGDKPQSQINTDYVINQEIAFNAYQELFNEPKSITLDEVKAWLMKYRSSFEFFDEEMDLFDFDPMDWHKFFKAFDFLQRICGLMDNLEQEESLKLPQIHSNFSEKVQIEKICMLEEILLNERAECLIDTLRAENNYRVVYQTLELEDVVFEEFSTLWAWFKPLQLSLVKKYYSLTELETEQFLESEEYMDPEFTLTQLGFHMDIRKRAREKGEYIPYYL